MSIDYYGNMLEFQAIALRNNNQDSRKWII